MSDAVRDEVAARYAALDLRSQEALLVDLAYWLTMEGRGCYGWSERVEDLRRLGKINETVHRIVDQLDHMIAGRSKRYPDDIFANILADHVESLGFKATWLLKFFDKKKATR